MAHKVKIAARLRPRLTHEVDDGGIQVIRSDDGSAAISVQNPRDLSQIFKFPFTSCYDETSTQEEIFDRDVEPMIDIVYSGVTVTIFAYGVTSSGKTHTMQGTAQQPGVIPRVVEALFLKRDTLADAHNISVGVSYMEIYKDEVYDLLVERESAPKLPVREDHHGKVFVANLSVLPIRNAADFDRMFARANKQRSVGATLLNRASSRSHAIVTIEVSMLDPAQGKTFTGKINLVDLAGSENNKLTGNDPSRMAESAAINKSLSVLGQVVHALNQNQSRIPYRNSKLTRILQDALGGSSVGLLICNLAPGTKFRQDTLNTLNFAVRTKNIENKPVVNEKDNRPAPKPHFAAVATRAPRSTLANIPTGPLPPVPTTTPSTAVSPPTESGPGFGIPHINLRTQQRSSSGSSTGRPASRPSLAPNARVGPSRVPRMSVAGLAALGNLGFGGLGQKKQPEINEEDMEDKIRRIVEAEVERRMEGVREQEREAAMAQAREEARAEIVRQREQEAAERQRQEQEQISDATTRVGDESWGESTAAMDTEADGSAELRLPPGVLTPLLKRHADLDGELTKRLEELERRLERGDKEMKMADVMSPVSRKKTGRAYVSLARQHTEKGDLQIALDFYRKAEKYVPDNVKLKERIIEIDWCIRNGTEFRPSPKKPKRTKGTKPASGAKKARGTKSTQRRAEPTGPLLDEPPLSAAVMLSDDEQQEVEEIVSGVRARPGRERGGSVTFGTEVTNAGSMSPGKRHADEDGGEDAPMDAPPRRKRRSAAKSVILEIEDSEDEDGVDAAPVSISVPRRSKRKAGGAH